METNSEPVIRLLSGVPGRTIKLPDLTDEKGSEKGSTDFRQIRPHQ